MSFQTTASLIAFTSWLLLTAACANIVAPTGGDKDTQAPRLDSLRSTKSEQTNFKKQDIVLTFDEWLKLKDVFNQVVVSPPLDYNPKVSLKKRSVVFKFDDKEVLKEEATYIINFGEAITDLNEGNAVKDLRFVFATGDFIDSLEVTGKVVDAFTGEAVEDVLLMLYDNLADSVVRTQRPFYFARTDKQGFYHIGNVKSDTFKVFALTDANLNYLYDNQQEKIGFPDSVLVVADSLPNSLNLKLFAENQSLRLLDKELADYGLIRLVFNDNPKEKMELSFQDIGQNAWIEYQKDSLKIWYDLAETKAWEVYVQIDTMEQDTLKIKGLEKAKFTKNRKLRLLKKIRPNTTNRLHPLKPNVLEFNHPIVRIDTAAIRFYEDTTRRQVFPIIEIDSLNKRLLRFSYKWKSGLNYALEIDSAAMSDWYGLTNDTLRLAYQISSLEDYGDIQLKLEKLEANQPYVMQLFFNESELVDELAIQADSTFQKKYEKLNPGNYTVQIIEDRNGNGRWDSGHYDEKRQPERLMRRKLEELRANWELEANVIVAPALR